jgi:predicted CXXCH cytochrome family protein
VSPFSLLCSELKKGVHTPVMKRAFLCLVLISVGLAAALSGCDSVTRHKVLTTIFDGVPSLPPPEQLCMEYAEAQVAAAMQEELPEADASQKFAGSTHLPYAEKNCNGCHDRNKEGGLILPRAKLCFACHTDFFKGKMLHGPAAVGACLSCHSPHKGRYPNLLMYGKTELCNRCHQESRIAAKMHDRLTAQNMACVDCHDPHSGDVPYFLK